MRSDSNAGKPKRQIVQTSLLEWWDRVQERVGDSLLSHLPVVLHAGGLHQTSRQSSTSDYRVCLALFN